MVSLPITSTEYYVAYLWEVDASRNIDRQVPINSDVRISISSSAGSMFLFIADDLSTSLKLSLAEIECVQHASDTDSIQFSILKFSMVTGEHYSIAVSGSCIPLLVRGITISSMEYAYCANHI